MLQIEIEKYRNMQVNEKLCEAHRCDWFIIKQRVESNKCK